MNNLLVRLKDILSAIDKGDRQALEQLGVTDDDVRTLKAFGLVTIEPKIAISEAYDIEPDKSVDSIAKLRHLKLTAKGRALLAALEFE